MFRARLVVILLLSLLAWTAIGQQKPDFSGRSAEKTRTRRLAGRPVLEATRYYLLATT
jgi:hypothetical protein